MTTLEPYLDPIYEYLARCGAVPPLDAATIRLDGSLVVNLTDLHGYSPEGVDALTDHTDESLGELTDYARELLKVRIPEVLRDHPLEVQLVGHPQETPLRLIRSHMIGRLVSTAGIVVKITQTEPKLSMAAYICGVCERRTMVPQRLQYREEPRGKCEECDNRRMWTLDPMHSVYEDVQLLKLQEAPESLPSGQMPRTFTYELKGLLCGRVNAGDRVRLTAVVDAAMAGKGSPERKLEMYGRCLGVEYLAEDAEDLECTSEEAKAFSDMAQQQDMFQTVTDSIAPSLYGLHEEKKCVAAYLMGGESKEMEDARIRGDISVLLVGDPGLAKSQILRFAVKASPRGLYTTGRGSSAAGLTAAVVKDKDIGYSLEAGALVLADKGHCISEDQLIVTPTGVTTVKPGKPSMVVSYDKGYKALPVRCLLDKGVRKAITIKTFDGSELCCTPDHKVLTNRGWVEAGDLTTKDSLVIPASYDPVTVVNQREFEDGFIYGFGLSDIYVNEKSKKNYLTFSASEKNQVRTDYVTELIRKTYATKITVFPVPASTQTIKGHTAEFSKGTQVGFSSRPLKAGLIKLFESSQLPCSTDSFKMGFLSGIFSTDCNISHKKTKRGIKHVIEVNLNRQKYHEKWLKEKMFLIKSILNNYGVYATIRGHQLQINSLFSYNRVVNLLSGHLSGRNADKLTPVTPKAYISSYDCWLNDDYCNWFLTRKIYTPPLVKHKIASRYHQIKTRRIMTTYAVDLFRKYWSELSNEPFLEPNKNYLLNPVTDITDSGLRTVYDLTIEGEPNFLTIGGIVHNCAVDEIEKMEENDRRAIHPALEQQIVPINKGGINTTLNARCGVLAAANPKDGRYNPYLTVVQNINLEATLLNRFDLIRVMKDKPDAERDAALADHLLRVHSGEQAESPLSLRELRKYVAYCRKHIHPEVPAEVGQQLKDYYLSLRRTTESDNGDPKQPTIMITPRQFESCIRVTEAVARARLHEVATEDDAYTALGIIESSMEQVGVDPSTGERNIDSWMTGKPRGQREKIELLRNMIWEMQNEASDGYCDYQEMLGKATEKGLFRVAEVTKFWEEIKKQDGLEPILGKIKVLKPEGYRGKRGGLQAQLQTVLGKVGEMGASGGVRDEDLYAELEKMAIGRSEAAKLIGVLMKDGNLFSPRPGLYKRA